MVLNMTIIRFILKIICDNWTGMLAEEVLSACDEHGGEEAGSSSTSEMGLANPAVHFFR